MKKLFLRDTVVASAACIVLYFVALGAHAGSVLVSNGSNGYGIGNANWEDMTAALDTASGNSVDIVANFENLPQMLGYDALWLDQRWIDGSLTGTEISNISSFIDTGRRIVMVGDNANWAVWNSQIVGIAGGSFAGSASSNFLATILANELTAGVTTIEASASGTAIGGTALFDFNTVTLWGAGNVLTMLDFNTCSVRDWLKRDNAVFCGNVANWVAASPVPVPASIWLFGSALGFLGWMRRRK